MPWGHVEVKNERVVTHKAEMEKALQHHLLQGFSALRSQDSNLELPDPESGALPIWPLLNEETNYTIIFLKFIEADEKNQVFVYDFSRNPGMLQRRHKGTGHPMTTGAEKL